MDYQELQNVQFRLAQKQPKLLQEKGVYACEVVSITPAFSMLTDPSIDLISAPSPSPLGTLHFS